MKGEGVKADPIQAVRYFKMAADAGDAKAQYEVAEALASGNGAEKNWEEAARYYKMASDGGFRDAMWRYGTGLMIGRGVKWEEESGAQLILRAAELGCVPAMRDAAKILFKGIGVPQNFIEAANYLRKHGSSGDEEAKRFCRKHLHQMAIAAGPNAQEAVALLKDAIEQGSPRAMFSYAEHLYSGDGVKKNVEEAQRYFKRSADEGDSGCKRKYANLLFSGEYVPKNPSEAARYYKMSADMGSPSDKEKYALMLLSGRRVPKNDAEAARYFKMAADEGTADNKFCYGKRLLEGDGIPKNVDEAKRYFKIAMDAGSISALIELEKLEHPDGNVIKDAYSKAKQVADKGSPASKRVFAVKFTEINPGEAAHYLKMAAEEGDEEEKKAYVDKRIAGLTVPKNAEEVVDCLKRWAQEGDSFSARRYAELLVEKDEYELSCQYFHIACLYGMGAPQLSFADHRNRTTRTIGGIMKDLRVATAARFDQSICHKAEVELGKILYNGEGGIDKNIAHALWYFKQAMKYEPEAKYYYGLCLLNGDGVDQNVDQAAAVFKEACEGLLKLVKKP